MNPAAAGRLVPFAALIARSRGLEFNLDTFAQSRWRMHPVPMPNRIQLYLTLGLGHIHSIAFTHFAHFARGIIAKERGKYGRSHWNRQRRPR